MKNILLLFILLFASQNAYSLWENAGWRKDANINSMFVLNNKIIISDKNGIRISTDNGLSWIQTKQTQYINNFAQSEGIIAASTVSGEVLISKDEGITWNNISNEIIKKGIISLAVSGNNIIAGSYTGAEIYISTNLGNTWEVKSSGLPINNDLYISSIAVIENNIFISLLNAFSSGGGGLFLSTDMGNTWVEKGLSNKNVNNVFFNGGKLFAYSGKLHVSNDMGNTWEPTDFIETIQSFSIDENSIYAGTHNGVYFSDDNGITWSEMGLKGESIHSIYFLGKRLAASTSKGIYVYDDLKNEWQQIYEVLNYGGITYFDVYGNNVFAGNEKSLYLSKDNGNTWKYLETKIKKMKLLKMSGDKLFLGTEAGLFLSTDLGNSWAAKDTEDSLLKNININNIIFNGDYIYTGTNLGLYVSSDKGETWIHKDTPDSLLENAYIYTIIDNGNNIYLGTSKGFFYSTDSGNSWSNNPDEINVLTSKPISSLLEIDGNIYAASYGVFMSSDWGKNWVAKSTGLPNFYIKSLTKLENNNLIVHINSAGYESGIYSSSNNGESWEFISEEGFTFNNNTGFEVGKFIVSNNNFIVGTPNTGVFLSSGIKNKWTARNEGLTSLSIKSFALKDEYIFAGTSDGFNRAKLNELINISEVGDITEPDNFIFPNPASDFIEINTGKKGLKPFFETANIQIFDMLGIKVISTPSLRDTPQEGNFRIDVSDLQPGVYFIRIGEKVEKFVKM